MGDEYMRKLEYLREWAQRIAADSHEFIDCLLTSIEAGEIQLIDALPLCRTIT